MYDPTPQNLQTLAPDVRDCAIILINAYRAAGYPAVITSARRSQQRQNELIGQGLTTATNSRHLSGRAIDIAFLGVPSPPLSWFSAGAALWKAMGGRWGGEFSWPDPMHFDG